MSDPTENKRRHMAQAINSNPLGREELAEQFGDDVYDTAELSEEFEVVSFAAPFIVVRHKATGKLGSLYFQHKPRFYFGFQED